SLDSSKLEKLYIKDNKFSSDLSLFSEFIELHDLDLSNDKEREGVYNRFTGSLEPLKNLTKLTDLNINDTDIEKGLEYLYHNGIKSFYCRNKLGNKDNFAKNLRKWGEENAKEVEIAQQKRKNEELEKEKEGLEKDKESLETIR
ncbi:13189_t:CDS:2, partial [Funneliformis geosporum]